MLKLNPYISLPGTASQAIELYEKVFNAEPAFIQRFKDMPNGAGERILHAMFQVGMRTDRFGVSWMINFHEAKQ